MDRGVAVVARALGGDRVGARKRDLVGACGLKPLGLIGPNGEFREYEVDRTSPPARWGQFRMSFDTERCAWLPGLPKPNSNHPLLAACRGKARRRWRPRRNTDYVADAST
jgi:hypothetical protein